MTKKFASFQSIILLRSVLLPRKQPISPFKQMKVDQFAEHMEKEFQGILAKLRDIEKQIHSSYSGEEIFFPLININHKINEMFFLKDSTLEVSYSISSRI